MLSSGKDDINFCGSLVIMNCFCYRFAFHSLRSNHRRVSNGSLEIPPNTPDTRNTDVQAYIKLSNVLEPMSAEAACEPIITTSRGNIHDRKGLTE
jgi:hypothetical protein